MKNKLLIFVILVVTLIFPLSACNSEETRDEHLSYFETEVFTEESFKEAVKLYGDSSLNSDGETNYRLTDHQAEVSYKNPTVKPLLNSDYYDNCDDDNIYISKLWGYLGKELFAEDITFTVDSLVSTIKKYCVWSATTHYIISECDYAISNNPSVKEICQNNGAEFFNKLYTEEYDFYENDLIDLFNRTDTWATNCSIAYKSKYLSYSYPLAFEKYGWDSGLSSEIASCIKNKLRDPDSYQSDGTVRFYLEEEPSISNGIYYSSVYVRVPYRAKNGFGGYNSSVCWLRYNWRNRHFSWYGTTMPSGINFFSFKTL